jgi:hypothetical protein
LISFQRFLVIYEQKWSSYIFGGNGKYFVCVVGWVVIVLGNSVFISPPTEFGPPGNVNVFLFVYNGHYKIYITYIRVLCLFLLSSTVLLYLAAIVIVSKKHKKVTPMGHSNALRAKKEADIEMTVPGPSGTTSAAPSVSGQAKVNQGTSRVQSNQMATLRLKKIISTLQLVGFLIVILVIFTGPFIVALSCCDNFPIQIKQAFFVLYAINSVLNPIIYVWKLVDIREIVKSALCCCKT